MTPDRLTESERLDRGLVAEVTRLFEAFLEAEVPLFDREVLGHRYWHYVRFQFFDEVLTGRGWIQRSRLGARAGRFTKIVVLLRLLKNWMLYGIQHDRRPGECLILNSGNKFVENGRHLDRFTDVWLSDFKHTFTIWEDHLRWRHSPRNSGRPVYYLDGMHLRAFWRQFWRRLDQAAIAREADFLCRWAAELGGEVSRSAVVRILTNTLALLLAGADPIRRQLQRKRPKLLLLVNHYDPLKMLITATARRLGLYTVELQHGNMGRCHIGYNFAHTRALPTLPDEILTFGRFWNETTRIGQNGVRLTAVGLPFFEERVRKIPPAPRHDKTRILILSQEALAARFSELAVQLVAHLDSQKYEVHYKMHPLEYAGWRETYPKAFQQANIRVHTNADLYRLLNETDVHVGVYSTTIIESLAFGKKLILLEAYGVHYFVDLIRSGRAQFARNADEVLQAIEAPWSPDQQRANLSYYWEPDSRRKLLARLEELLA